MISHSHLCKQERKEREQEGPTNTHNTPTRSEKKRRKTMRKGENKAKLRAHCSLSKNYK
jgi:hypothetical protein